MNRPHTKLLPRSPRLRRKILCAAATGRWPDELPNGLLTEPVPQRAFYRCILAIALSALALVIVFDHQWLLFTGVRSRPDPFLGFIGFGLLLVWSANYAQRHHWPFSPKNPLRAARTAALTVGLTIGLHFLVTFVACGFIVILACLRVL